MQVFPLSNLSVLMSKKRHLVIANLCQNPRGESCINNTNKSVDYMKSVLGVLFCSVGALVRWCLHLRGSYHLVCSSCGRCIPLNVCVVHSATLGFQGQSESKREFRAGGILGQFCVRHVFSLRILVLRLLLFDFLLLTTRVSPQGPPAHKTAKNNLS